MNVEHNFDIEPALLKTLSGALQRERIMLESLTRAQALGTELITANRELQKKLDKLYENYGDLYAEHQELKCRMEGLEK